ncbi:MAG: hypothetical protein J2P19_30810, partial [Pseudonocardia sp.]|nr:hypothetical protein [Pseudonocardia sp.]
GLLSHAFARQYLHPELMPEDFTVTALLEHYEQRDTAGPLALRRGADGTTGDIVHADDPSLVDAADVIDALPTESTGRVWQVEDSGPVEVLITRRLLEALPGVAVLFWVGPHPHRAGELAVRVDPRVCAAFDSLSPDAQDLIISRELLRVTHPNNQDAIRAFDIANPTIVSAAQALHRLAAAVAAPGVTAIDPRTGLVGILPETRLRPAATAGLEHARQAGWTGPHHVLDAVQSRLANARAALARANHGSAGDELSKAMAGLDFADYQATFDRLIGMGRSWGKLLDATSDIPSHISFRLLVERERLSLDALNAADRRSDVTGLAAGQLALAFTESTQWISHPSAWVLHLFYDFTPDRFLRDLRAVTAAPDPIGLADADYLPRRARHYLEVLDARGAGIIESLIPAAAYSTTFTELRYKDPAVPEAMLGTEEADRILTATPEITWMLSSNGTLWIAPPDVSETDLAARRPALSAGRARIELHEHGAEGQWLRVRPVEPETTRLTEPELLRRARTAFARYRVFFTRVIPNARRADGAPPAGTPRPAISDVPGAERLGHAEPGDRDDRGAVLVEAATGVVAGLTMLLTGGASATNPTPVVTVVVVAVGMALVWRAAKPVRRVAHHAGRWVLGWLAPSVARLRWALLGVAAGFAGSALTGHAVIALGIGITLAMGPELSRLLPTARTQRVAHDWLARGPPRALGAGISLGAGIWLAHHGLAADIGLAGVFWLSPRSTQPRPEGSRRAIR